MLLSTRIKGFAHKCSRIIFHEREMYFSREKSSYAFQNLKVINEIYVG